MNNQNSFDPSAINKEYTASQWQAKEDYYTKKVQGINIPNAPTPADIAGVANQIEETLCLARLDMAFVQQRFDSYKKALDIDYKESFYTVKMQQLQQNSNAKLTVSDIESMVITVIKNTPFKQGSNLNIYQVLDEYQKRYTFISTIIKILCDKKDLLITHSSVIKAETSLNNFSNANINADYSVTGRNMAAMNGDM